MADTKRMRYFDQQLLVLKDFTDEQDYHVEMRRRHNRMLHTRGVASGLDVTKTGVKEITVKAGMAIDNQGREISLDADTKIDLSNDALFPAASSVLVTISYAEEQTDPSGTATQNTRIKEKFNLVAAKETTGSPADSTVVQLARVVLDAQGTLGTPDMSVRRQAGASAFDNPDASFTIRSLRLSNPGFPNTQWPTLTASGANQVAISGSLTTQSLTVISDINLSGSLKAAADLSGRNLSVSGALSATTGTINGALNVAGSLVIGSGNPQTKLQVTTGVIVPAVGNSPQAGIQFPPNPGGGAGDEAFIRYFAVPGQGEATKLLIGIGNDLDDTIGFFQAGAERLTISAGNIGIGTPTPDAPLRVKQSASALALKVTANRGEPDSYKQPIVEFRHDNESQGVGIGYASIFATGSNQNQILSIFARGTGFLLLNSEGGGNIGVGTSTPDRKLTVAQPGVGAGVYANIKNDNHEILFGVDATAIVSAMTASDLQLRTNNAPRLVVKATTGNVGVGSSGTIGRLSIAGSAGEGQGIQIDNREIKFRGDGDAHYSLYANRSPGRFTIVDTSASPNMDLAGTVLMSIAKGTGMVEMKSLNVERTIESPMWNVSSIFSSKQGPLPLSTPITSNGGILVIFATGSGFATGVGHIGMIVRIDNADKAIARSFTNEVSSHKAFVSNAVVVSGIPAGQHTLSLVNFANTITDANDFFSVTVFELPWTTL